MCIKRVILLCFLLLSSYANAALDIKNWTTKNGSRVYFVESHKLPVVDINIMFTAGSVRDTEETNGLASMTNHLMFSGSAGIGEQELMNSFADIGAQVGSNFNRDQSSFSLRTLSDKKTKAIDLFKLVLHKPDFDQNILARETKRYVANISQAETMPEAIATKKFMKSIYGNHPYGFPSSGTIDSLNRIKSTDLKNFYSNYYIANQAVIVIVGDVSNKQAKSIAEELSKGLPINKNIKEHPRCKKSYKTRCENKSPCKTSSFIFWYTHYEKK